MAWIAFEMVFYSFVIAVILLTLILQWIWSLLKWLYQTLKPVVIEMWKEWQRQLSEARKPQDIRAAGVSRRHQVDVILADYRQQVNQVLKTKYHADHPEVQSFKRRMLDQ